ncbi:hypothetical protein TNCV_3003261 [Trichonephila clavipes]|nr:hypothetical protein TNCV_3003261 [Trichonephila clavipes]
MRLSLRIRTVGSASKIFTMMSIVEVQNAPKILMNTTFNTSFYYQCLPNGIMRLTVVPKGPSSNLGEGCGSPVVKISDHGRHVMSSSLVPLKPSLVKQRCTLYLSRAETSSCWCGAVVRRGDASSGIVHVT